MKLVEFLVKFFIGYLKAVGIALAFTGIFVIIISIIYAL